MNDFAQYGILGVVVITLAGYIVSIEKRHRDEREEWRKSDEKKADKMMDSLDKNTSVLQGLKTLLENRR